MNSPRNTSLYRGIQSITFQVTIKSFCRAESIFGGMGGNYPERALESEKWGMVSNECGMHQETSSELFALSFDEGHGQLSETMKQERFKVVAGYQLFNGSL